MVSLKSFLQYFRHEVECAMNDTDKAQAERLVSGFGGRDNIRHIDACLTRLRVTVAQLSQVDSQALQSEGALGVIIIGHEVHAIFGTQSDNLRQLLEKHFSQL
ncbi:glucose PTS transporter subunit EIIB [Mangrovibacter yixingensis]|uniref:glucose PTS transporter subunit EIIB n=1 Tax=Mangrovibacter yixingensis TaxID=1529639 RepID=UPI001CF9EE87|nr:glucose PTS transporter subunit EIIB [Mangrovibacter yixingensis]